MRSLYSILESIADSDIDVEKDVIEKSSEAGRIMQLLVDNFKGKFSWEADIRVLGERDGKASKDSVFGISYFVYDRNIEVFRNGLKKEGFKIVPTHREDNHKQFLISFKGPIKRGKVEMEFKAFADHTYVDLRTDKSNKQALIDLFNKYFNSK